MKDKVAYQQSINLKTMDVAYVMLFMLNCKTNRVNECFACRPINTLNNNSRMLEMYLVYILNH